MASAFEVCRREILRYIEKFGHGRYSDLLRDLPFDDGLIKLTLDKMNESGELEVEPVHWDKTRCV